MLQSGPCARATPKSAGGKKFPDSRETTEPLQVQPLSMELPTDKLQVSSQLFPLSGDFAHGHGVPPTENEPLPYSASLPRPATPGGHFSSPPRGGVEVELGLTPECTNTHHNPIDSHGTLFMPNLTSGNLLELDTDSSLYNALTADPIPQRAVNPGYVYPYTADLVLLNQCRESNPVSLPTQAQHITTPLVVGQWESLLQDHPDRPLVQYIVTGMKEGFRVGFRRDYKYKRASGNMRSAIMNPKQVADFIQAEVQAGRVIGPLQDIREVHVSRFGVIPKQGQPGKWRLILDLSSPHGSSVNDGYVPELSSIRYATVDDAVQKILHLGKNTLLAKINIEHAYRNIPIHPDDRHLLGMSWEGSLYIDAVLPFGLRSAPKFRRLRTPWSG